MSRTRVLDQPLLEVRDSPLHGLGVFAARRIGKGTRIIEYLGERITQAEADTRYDDEHMRTHHTFLFSVDVDLAIDAGVNGNDARFINHSCEPNCEAVNDDNRIFIEAIRAIKAGEELFYDYMYERTKEHTKEDLRLYVCRCGTKSCRGTILKWWPVDVGSGGKKAG